ncbi:lipid-A-disaccharide synthase [bacterium]|nr:lipid-A-disaccharide synthase [bacterium]
MMNRVDKNKTNKDQINFLIVAGEASGDLLGGSLVRELKKLIPDAQYWGVGGDSMKSAGVEIVYPLNDLGVTGFTEVFLKFGHILRVFRGIQAEARKQKPDIAILIDYPDFNLRLARRLKNAGVLIAYYVSPQMWAWRSGRVKIVQKYVDKMMVLFPFEEIWYRERGASAEFVGHPLLDRIRRIPERNICRNMLGIDSDEYLISMLPGSRFNEVKRILPVMLEAHDKLITKSGRKTRDGRRIRFLMPLSETMPESSLPINVNTRDMPVETVSGKTLEIVKASDFVWVTSGTASLETALMHTPQVVVYKITPASYYLAKALAQVDYISIANLVLDLPVALELIQDSFNADNLISETYRFMDNEVVVNQNRKLLEQLDNKFGSPGASRRAAAVIHKMLTRPSTCSGV